MGKIRRNNYIFLTWKGDHSPGMSMCIGMQNS